MPDNINNDEETINPVRTATLQDFAAAMERFDTAMMSRNRRGGAAILEDEPVFIETSPEEDVVVKESKSLKNEHYPVRLHKGGQIMSNLAVRTRCGRWFKKDDPDVVKDVLDQELIYKEASVRVIASFDSEGLPINTKESYLYTDPHNTNRLTILYYSVTKGETTTVLQAYTLYKLLPIELYQESMLNGSFYHLNTKLPNKVKIARYRKAYAIKSSKYFDYTSKQEVARTTEENFKFGIKSPSYKITEGKKYSFGVELETILGVMPAHLDDELNYEAVHDGSLKGPNGEEPMGAEYVTGVLVGDTGFLQLKRLCNELTKRCKVDKRCGVHVHIGGMEFNKAKIVYLYKLLLMLEKDIFAMLPPSRRKNEYCRTLKPINLNFVETDFKSAIDYDILIENYHNKIMEFLSYSGLSPRVSKKFDHPLGHKCGYKHETARYCWANFIPAVFNTRRNGIYTFEFRPYAGTTSYEKIKYWILICMGIMWFVENHYKEIALSKEMSLKDVIDKAYPNKGVKIISFIQKRMSKFKSSDNDPVLQEQLDYEEIVTDPSLSIKSI